MDIGSFQAAAASQGKEIKFYRMTILGLVVALLGMMYLLSQKDQLVTIIPNNMTEPAQVSKGFANSEFKKSWALSLSVQMGNLTPTTLGYTVENLKPLLSSRIYGDVVAAMSRQAEAFKQDRITISFEPREVSYEQETGKAFVTGVAEERGVGAKTPKVTTRTYEYNLAVSNYAVVINDLNVYEGPARTLLWKQQNPNYQSANKEVAVK